MYIYIYMCVCICIYIYTPATQPVQEEATRQGYCVGQSYICVCCELALRMNICIYNMCVYVCICIYMYTPATQPVPEQAEATRQGCCVDRRCIHLGVDPR